MTLTFELDLDMTKTNERAIHADQRSCISEVIVQTHIQRYTYTGHRTDCYT